MSDAKMKTNTPLDKILDGGIERNTITNIYGPAGSGKTNITMITALQCLSEGKVVYFDTEGSFSPERFVQIGGTQKDMKNIIFIEAHTWEEQNKKMISMQSIIDKEKNVKLVVVDSMVALYRLELDNDNFQAINKQLALQYAVLSKIAREKNIAILVTSQVYSDAGNIEMSSRNISKYWSKALIELKKSDKDNHRIAILRKHRSLPEGRKIDMEITESGVRESKFSLF
jgi:DNA repair protein RadB